MKFIHKIFYNRMKKVSKKNVTNLVRLEEFIKVSFKITTFLKLNECLV